MNLYKLFILFFSYNCVICFNVQNSRKHYTNLYMKRKSQSNINLYIPRTEKQKEYVKYLDDNNNKVIVSLGPAGTGKTLFACQKGITQLKTEEINKIIITRPVVTVEEEIGFLPGNIIKKMDPWTKPLFDIFLEYFSKTELDMMLINNKIEICPLAFMRGRTFKNAFIIADEMQNSSPNQMKMLTTRLGDNSRLVITGDLNQSDIKTDNGLNDFILRLNKYQYENNSTNLIKMVEFDNIDIERSEIVKKIIEIYDFNTKHNFEKKNSKKTLKENNIEINSNNNKTNIENKNKIINSDAALIPKYHFTHNYDIFFEARDF